MVSGSDLLEESTLLLALRDMLNDKFRRCVQRDASLTPSEALSSAIGRVRAGVARTISLHISRHNRTARVLTGFPTELLPEVLGYLELADRIAASHVCNPWRDAALRAVPLWADIASLGQSPGVLASRLSRVPLGTPMQLAVAINPRHYKEALIALRERIPDFRTLWIRNYGTYGENITALATALSQPAPLLTHLGLMLGDATRISWNSAPLLANDAPHLHSLKYFGTRDALSDWPLRSQLRHVLFSEPSTTPASLHAIFDMFDHVERLSIEFQHWVPSTSPATSESTVRLSHNLKSLALLSDTNSVDPHELLQFVSHRTVPVLYTGFVRHATAAASVEVVTNLSSALNQTIDSLILWSTGISGSDPGCIHVCMETLGCSYKRIILHTKFSLRDGVEAYPNLTTLVISEELLPDGSGEYDLPQVKNLGVVLLDEEAQIHRGHDSLFLFAYAPTPLLVCPLVEVVEIASLSGTIIAPEMVSKFLYWHVKSVQRPTLQLSKVELVQNNVWEVIALLGLLTDIIEDTNLDGSNPRDMDFLIWEDEMTLIRLLQ